MKLDVVTPTGAKLKDLEVREVTLPGVRGEMGVLPSHIAMLAGLGIGPMVIEGESGRMIASIANGYVEILDDRILVLAESCELAEEVDIDRANASLAAASACLGTTSQYQTEAWQAARQSVKKAETRIRVAGMK